MEWKFVDLLSEKAVDPNDLLPYFNDHNVTPVALLIDNTTLAESSDDVSYGLLKSIVSYEGLTVLQCKGCGGGWALGLVASVDIVLAANDTSFSLKKMGEKTAGFTAAMLVHSIGKARTMQLIVDGEIDVERLHKYGVVSKITRQEASSRPQAFVTELFEKNATEAAVKLKRTWRAQEGVAIDEALAAERIEFQRCFREGAAEEIADYLSNHHKAVRD